jgi:hypothetical protein
VSILSPHGPNRSKLPTFGALALTKPTIFPVAAKQNAEKPLCGRQSPSSAKAN